MDATWILLARPVWFVVFFIMAWRAHALTGKNVFAAVITGLSAAWIALYFSELLDQWRRAGEASYQRPSLDILEGLYILGFPGVFALLRRLFNLRGFSRDFWLLAGCAAPLFPLFFLTDFFLYVSFFAGPL